MKKSPFSGRTVMLANGDDIDQLRFGNGESLALSSTGEINASDVQDLKKQIDRLMASMSSGAIVQTPKRSEQLRQYKEILLSAMSSDNNWKALGADLATQIEEQVAREAFYGKVLMPQTLNPGERPYISCQQHDVQAVVATGPAEVGFQRIMNKQWTPVEFELLANVMVDRMSMDQLGGQVLEDAYNQGLEALMVKMDRLLKQAADRTINVVNTPVYFSGRLTPELMMDLRQGISDWNLPTANCFISNSFWKDMASQEWNEFLDPVTKADLALSGQLGQLLGMPLTTDGFRNPNQKVLGNNEIYVFTSPEHLGCYSDRGGIRSEPTSGANQGSTAKGWLLSMMVSMTLVNPRGVVVGRRL